MSCLHPLLKDDVVLDAHPGIIYGSYFPTGVKFRWYFDRGYLRGFRFIASPIKGGHSIPPQCFRYGVIFPP
ncbi:hypothetical protein CEXT_246921 [Caerostris extrusa]|uniref:Uncharacterized protein n=1 Tax=Caerostris extrusa TaxID=172846 RepID=A0AAV4UY37_CAEEX|nr:hypothetical protein CEXT_246921 [Caerostris extrusa]